jgi:UbiD family decarboxylase
MELRRFLAAAEQQGWVQRLDARVDPQFEMARLIHALDERVTLFSQVSGWPSTVVAGLCSRREHFALALGVEPAGLLQALVAALAQPLPPTLVDSAPCQEVVSADVDLSRLPILTHLPGDGGPYVTAGVAIIRDPVRGRNAAYHRLMQVGPRTFTARLVEGRGTHTAWSEATGPLPMAVCIGAPLAVQLAASMSPPAGVDELAIANALAPMPTVRAIGLDLEIPAESEIVLEGHLTRELGDEGPFLDLTGTRDRVRQQPFFVVDCVTHRRDPLYQALLPGGREHRLLMGMPREPTIYAAVNRVCACCNVHITPGGGNWLHAVVQIDKRSPSDGHAAIHAAFEGHSSLKHVVIVDRDVDLYSTEAVEWAIATRFQADRDLVVLRDQPSSSLDPSALHVVGRKARTAKLGLDATIHWDTSTGPAHPADWQALDYEPIDPATYGAGGPPCN